MPRELISLVCGECKRRNYTVTKNKKLHQEKLELSKFCQACRKHTLGPNLLSLWKATFLEKAHLAFDNESARSAEQVRIAELEQVLGRMTMENEILKKASTRLSSLSTRNEK